VLERDRQLCFRVNLVPLEVRNDRKVDAKQRSGDRLNLSCNLYNLFTTIM